VLHYKRNNSIVKCINAQNLKGPEGGCAFDLCYKNSSIPFSISCALQGTSLVLFLYLQELFIYHVQSHQWSSWRCRTENVFGSLISTRIKKRMLFIVKQKNSYTKISLNFWGVICNKHLNKTYYAAKKGERICSVNKRGVYICIYHFIRNTNFHLWKRKQIRWSPLY